MSEFADRLVDTSNHSVCFNYFLVSDLKMAFCFGPFFVDFVTVTQSLLSDDIVCIIMCVSLRAMHWSNTKHTRRRLRL